MIHTNAKGKQSNGPGVDAASHSWGQQYGRGAGEGRACFLAKGRGRQGVCGWGRAEWGVEGAPPGAQAEARDSPLMPDTEFQGI